MSDFCYFKRKFLLGFFQVRTDQSRQRRQIALGAPRAGKKREGKVYIGKKHPFFGICAIHEIFVPKQEFCKIAQFGKNISLLQQRNSVKSEFRNS